MRTFLIALALLAGTIAQASAADPIGRAPMDVPAASDDGGKFSWTGFYIGGRAGGDLGVLDLGFSQADDGVYEDKGELNGLGLRGWTGGGQVGFDYARGSILIGVFGSYDWSNAKVDIRGVDIDPSGSHDALELHLDEKYSIEKDNEWSVGVRGGALVTSRTLVYLLVAYTEADFTSTRTGFEDSEDTLQGYTVGGGVEVAITPNVFAGLEATHTFYDDLTDTEASPGDDRVSFDLDETKVMGTLKIKLNADMGSLGF